MTTVPGAPTPAGWYPDPAGTDQLRWWDGAAWTTHLAARPVPTSAPATVPEYSTATTQYQDASDRYASSANSTPYLARDYSSMGRMTMEDATPLRWNTIWIWILVLSPVVLVIALSAVQTAVIQSFVAGGLSVEAIVVGAIAVPVLSLAAYITIAYQDQRVLRQWGYTKRTSPWWVLLFLVYLILRTNRVYRESRHGIAPLITYLVAYVVSGVISGALFTLNHASDDATQRIVERTAFEQEVTKGLDSRGGNFTFTCPDNFSLTIGTQYDCTAVDQSTRTSHTVDLEIVADSNGNPTAKLISVTPPISG